MRLPYAELQLHARARPYFCNVYEASDLLLFGRMGLRVATAKQRLPPLLAMLVRRAMAVLHPCPRLQRPRALMGVSLRSGADRFQHTLLYGPSPLPGVCVLFVALIETVETC